VGVSTFGAGIAVGEMVGPVVSPEQATARAMARPATAKRIFLMMMPMGD
jgi:hypothetical protein